jgi:hypothetical protein
MKRISVPKDTTETEFFPNRKPIGMLPMMAVEATSFRYLR